WNAQRALLKVDGKCEDTELPQGLPLINDLFIPEIERSESGEPLGSCTSTSLKYSGSEYLLGNVSVNVILPESNGATDPSTEDWNATLETNVQNEIVEGLNELRNLYTLTTSLKPSFTYHYYLGRTDTRARTQYEPINRNAAPSYNNCSSGEGLWACEILNNLGYSSYSGYTKAREFNGDARIADGTDWAFTIFVINSYNDTDGKFPDGWFGYAWLGGPWVVMTYDNDGWNISQMNKVVKHETGHIFYAFDEYSGSGCNCTEVSGYVNYSNQNCQNSCSSNVNCMMRDNYNAVCSYTKGQIGWGDSDSDTIPDPIDINPETSLTAYSPDPTTNTNLTYNGTATIQKLTNQNVYNYQCDINILTIANVQYRVDGGSWQNATPSDGSFNSATENYTFTVTLSGGTHTIETRAVDELGQTDTSYASDTVTVNVSTPPGVPNGVSGGAMTSVKSDVLGNTINLSWDNGCTGQSYSLVVGPGSGLPTNYSGTYTVDIPSCVCGMGGGNSYTWNNSLNPQLDPKGFYWWIVVATNSAGTTEGSWGKNSGNVERTGPGTNGSSGKCAVTNKDTSNTCGQ
ncbi:MAG: hypothetical protein GYA35_00505, partial [Thermoanaerobaculaceae bacterium]|nr:hypothetical protein [Thermoanaerobaculaceae bacterium]